MVVARCLSSHSAMVWLLERGQSPGGVGLVPDWSPALETSHLRGRRGESIAAEYLEGSGWTILARNWRDGSREIDLVALRDGVLAFVEVKTRSGGGMGPTLESITRRKRLEIVRAATAWLLTGGGIRGTCGSAHPGRPSFDVVRFDAIAVTLRREGSARVEHVPDAWRVGDH